MMQTQVMFYQLNDEEKTDTSSAFYHACLQASHFYRQNQRVFIYTLDKASSEQIDELLWSFDSDSFVPHNLVGEGPKQGAAIEISNQAPRGRRPVLINLTPTVPDFASQFQFIVDFVPTDEALKQQARLRFKSCRELGFQVQSTTVQQQVTS